MGQLTITSMKNPSQIYVYFLSFYNCEVKSVCIKILIKPGIFRITSEIQIHVKSHWTMKKSPQLSARGAHHGLIFASISFEKIWLTPHDKIGITMICTVLTQPWLHVCAEQNKNTFKNEFDNKRKRNGENMIEIEYKFNWTLSATDPKDPLTTFGSEKCTSIY